MGKGSDMAAHSRHSSARGHDHALDLGDVGVFVANITSNSIFADIPYWQADRGPVSGRFEGQESYTDETGLWSLNQLEPL